MESLGTALVNPSPAWFVLNQVLNFGRKNPFKNRIIDFFYDIHFTRNKSKIKKLKKIPNKTRINIPFRKTLQLIKWRNKFEKNVNLNEQ